MALTATVRRFAITLSDVDRGVYETLDLRVAQHPSESARYMLTRTLAYCLSYEEGIAFSKGGLSSTDEPPLCVRDATGVLTLWIEIGAPSAERLHKASKAARRVQLYTTVDLAQLRREAEARAIHKVEEIEIVRFEPRFVDELAGVLDRNVTMEIARSDARLYVTVAGRVLEGDAVIARLAPA